MNHPKRRAAEGDRAQSPVFEAVRDHFEEFGQGHVFRHWDRLGAASQRRLLDQAVRIDLRALQRIHADRARPAPCAARRLEPVAVERIPARGGDAARREAARSRGETLLAEGRVAALVVAGGQATRLDYEGPKGAFPLGPVTDRSLFEIQAQKIRGLRRRYGCALPWCVMTSPSTDAATRAFFRGAQFFGLPEEDVVFFQQEMVPSLDFAGRLVLEAPDRIFENPNGHGGSLIALEESGVLDALEDRGCDTLFYYQVDNPLVRMADPVYLGLHAAAGAEASCKVVRKADPMEKVGVVARVNGRIGVVEYTELTEEDRFATDAAGELVYWAGNIAIHLFATAFVRSVVRDAARLLPYHASKKKIPHLDDDGRQVTPSEPNGWKLERFVFDALPAAKTACIVEADRSLEFSPVKNASGSNSPLTARRDLVSRYREWLEAARVVLPEPGVAIEVDHSQIDGPDDAKRLGFQSIAEMGDVIRIAPGGSA